MNKHKFAFLAVLAMTLGTASPTWAQTVLVNSWEGTSDYDTRALGIGLQPPDVNGSVGTTQFAQLMNGSFAAYDKYTGALLAPRITDSAFFLNAGGTATVGDVRILFDPTSSRWIAAGFGSVTSRIQVAVSTTADALGPWRATSFLGVPTGGTADYPTLALTGDTVTIGTNNFNSGFRGVTLNTINRSDLFGAGAPTTASLLQFNTPFPGTGANDGFAQQGVSRAPGVGSGTDVLAASLTTNDLVTFNISTAGVKGPTTLLGSTNYQANSPGRQPDILGTGNARVVDTLDDRISATVYQAAGKIYAVHTVTPVGQDHTVIRISVIDEMMTLLSETDITGPDNSFDFYQGSLAVNAAGQFVVGFVRSGNATHPVDGRISIFARSFNTNPDGSITATSGDLLIKQSSVDDYHLGSPQGSAAAGRQRFGDYSSVSLDPTDSQRFYVVNEFAREFNNAAGGHPGGSGFGRWGTYVGVISVSAIPEPAGWVLMLIAFGFIGGIIRCRKTKMRVSYC